MVGGSLNTLRRASASTANATGVRGCGVLAGPGVRNGLSTSVTTVFRNLTTPVTVVAAWVTGVTAAVAALVAVTAVAAVLLLLAVLGSKAFRAAATVDVVAFAADCARFST